MHKLNLDNKMSEDSFLLGCERLIDSPPQWLRSARLGLLSNQASVSGSLRHVRELIIASGGRLSCLFSPQHGFYSEKQANMIESADGRDEALRIPVVSLYAETRVPPAEALDMIDILIIDLQDVGTRVYTYTTTMGLCMEAAALAGVKVVVLDRPNPITGTEIEGNLPDVEFRSFVGRYKVPMRHGLTPGEFAGLIRSEACMDCDLEVIGMRGWRRSRFYGDLGLHWIFPSPNMPTWETSLLYPGMVLLEGTNVSEGRGTTIPFQIFGAPWIDQARVFDRLEKSAMRGAVLRPVVFEPAFDKYKGEPCFGFQVHITDKKGFKPYRTGLAIIQALLAEHPEEFRWLDPPYEYEWEKLPIDILIGSGPVRRRIEAGEDLDILESEWSGGLAEYELQREQCRLYAD